MRTATVQFTFDEVISLMRAVAAKLMTESDTDKRDDLELIRLKLYGSVYPRQPETASSDHWQFWQLDPQGAQGPH